MGGGRNNGGGGKKRVNKQIWLLTNKFVSNQICLLTVAGLGRWGNEFEFETPTNIGLLAQWLNCLEFMLSHLPGALGSTLDGVNFLL